MGNIHRESGARRGTAASSMSAGLCAVILTLQAAAGCAHHPPVDPDIERRVDASVQSYRAWVGTFPRCEPRAKATEVDGLPRDADPQPVAARGILTLERDPQCTKMGCGGAACCNGCFPKWVLVPTETMPILKPYQREIAIQEAGQGGLLGARAQDCVFRRLGERLPEARVVVTGTLTKKNRGFASETITDASICLIALPP